MGGNSEIVAPFWADADNRESGNVWYRESTDSTLLTRVHSEIQAAFTLQAPFAATDLFIATWESVGYFDRKMDKVQDIIVRKVQYLTRCSVL